MTVLVTGGAGFIGSHVCERLLEQGEHVLILDNFDPYYSPKIKEKNLLQINKNPQARIIRGSLLNDRLLEKLFQKNRINSVIHLAAKAGVRASLEKPADFFRNNVQGTQRLLEHACKHRVQSIVFASSSSVYGNRNKAPFQETAPFLDPISPYAKTKAAGEWLCKSYSDQFAVSVTALRFFTVYGPRNRPDMALYKFAQAIQSEKPLQQFGDSSVKRDFTFVKDIVSGILTAHKKQFPGFEVFNLGNNKPTPLHEVIRLLEKNLGKEALIQHCPLPAGDATVTCADISKANKMLKWKPRISLEKGIKDFSTWFKNGGDRPHK